MEDAAASGGYEQEEHAAEAYDVAALKVKGLKNPSSTTPLSGAPCMPGRLPLHCQLQRADIHIQQNHTLKRYRTPKPLTADVGLKVAPGVSALCAPRACKRSGYR